MSDVITLTFFLNAFAMIAVFFLVYMASILLHEVGHLLVLRKKARHVSVYFKKVNGFPKIHAGKEEDYLDLSKTELRKVYATGIFLGVFPILFAAIVSPWFFLLIPLYIGGCSSDIKKLNALD